MNKLDLEETTRRFHNIYEQVAKEYGYKTREDTKELDFNSPNGMTMLKTVETITTPYLEEIERLNNIINDIDRYIHNWNLEDIGEKTMLILNDILLIKNGMSDEVVRLKDSDKVEWNRKIL